MARRRMKLDRKDAAKVARLQMLLPMVPAPLLARRVLKDKARRRMGAAAATVPPMEIGLGVNKRDIGIAIIGGLAGAFFGKMFK